jgi:hypothetical protein
LTADIHSAINEVMGKECRRCHVVKPPSQLKRDNRNGDGYSSFCKDCHQEASVAWQKANPERLKEYRRLRRLAIPPEVKKRMNKERYAKNPLASKDSSLRRLYGLSYSQYVTMLESQGGTCSICKEKPRGRALAVDHDHGCCPKAPTCGGCNRGLLCARCNLSLDVFLGLTSWAESAKDYIESWNKK